MLLRVKQFFSAVQANINREDIQFVQYYLSEKERKLFFKLDLPTQKHSINVARTALRLAKELGYLEKPVNIDFDITLLAKASLLHDIGKPAGGLKTWHRVIIVLMELILPASTFEKLCSTNNAKTNNTLTQALYLQKNHPSLGGKIALLNNLDSNLIYIIENHHNKLGKQSLELQLVQKADDLN